MKLVHWSLVGGLLHLVQRVGGLDGASPPTPLLAVPNVTAHPSTASVPITVLLHSGQLLCGFNVPAFISVNMQSACNEWMDEQTAPPIAKTRYAMLCCMSTSKQKLKYKTEVRKKSVRVVLK